MTPAPSPFCVDSVSLPRTGSGALDGLRFGAKDVFDVAGHVTGCGNPDWQRSHPPARHTASVIDALCAAGARMLGKTLTDELAYSLNGENWHYGTPPNPRAPGRIPGGSSSGSASAVAADLVDFAIGTDCGGSIRLPASFCGLYGMRPTHGRVATDGLVPLAASFDTVGWFAASAEHLKRVGAVLLGDDGPAPAGAPRRLVIAQDLFAQLGDAERAALQPALARLKQRFADIGEIAVGNRHPDELMQAFRTLQAAEIWAAHGDWITQERPRFGPGIAQRFANASQVTPADVDRAQDVRDAFRRRLAAMLTPGSLLCLPSAPGIAPALNAPLDAMELFRGKAMRLLCIAGLAGAPQVSLPVAALNGNPLGLSLMMSPGADRALLDFVAAHVHLIDPPPNGNQQAGE
ncbi:MAG TPA: amidase [Janthinobacterium sp.]|jgi:amidase|nr:amidase [Janthinobacterium sp.]